jgi:hypothetical protein
MAAGTGSPVAVLRDGAREKRAPPQDEASVCRYDSNLGNAALDRAVVPDGPLPTPDGRAPIVRGVWFVESQENVPRLVTLVPRRIVTP